MSIHQVMDDDALKFHLARVSRSFAFCIDQLSEPLRLWVGLTYLVCRALDTIEDTPYSDGIKQLKHFRQFDDFLKKPPGKEEIHLWLNDMPKADMASAEFELLSQASALLGRLHEQPQTMRQIVFDMISSMSNGMQHFVRRRIGGVMRLDNLNELNQYCFFVAGVVGESLAKLLSLVEPAFKIETETVMTAHHFGLFLQKVNIIKDAPFDKKKGRHFMTHKDELLLSLSQNAEQALCFLSFVPTKQREFRLFCGWSLFLGIGTLVKLQDSTVQENNRKLTPLETVEILGSVEKNIDDSTQIQGLFASWMKRLHVQDLSDSKKYAEKYSKKHSEKYSEKYSEILKLYRGVLDSNQLLQLGL